MAHTLTAYEQKVDELIAQLIAPHKSKLTLFSGDGGATGFYWELAPKNTHAAKAHVYSVTASSINLSVENFYWVRIPVEKGDWDAALMTLGGYLQAVIDGRVEGWFGRDKNGRAQYVLEFISSPEEEPLQFSSNMHFASLFKNRDDVSHLHYEAY